jgi:hypothetical protein
VWGSEAGKFQFEKIQDFSNEVPNINEPIEYSS